MSGTTLWILLGFAVLCTVLWILAPLPLRRMPHGDVREMRRRHELRRVLAQPTGCRPVTADGMPWGAPAAGSSDVPNCPPIAVCQACGSRPHAPADAPARFVPCW
ncbi:hypothetical protein [Streptomyces sp. NPDC054887]